MIGDLARLSRWRLCLLAGLSTLAGYAGARPQADAGLALATLAAVLAAAGCSALNQAQERREDARMARTSTRPLPAGRMRPAQALAFAAGCLSFSAGLFTLLDPRAPVVLAGIVLVYNGVYTPLKKRSSLAVLAGGLAGAAGPLLGSVAAGGPLFGFKALAAAAALYLWQVPHFWLLAREHADDYRQAGFACADGLCPRVPATGQEAAHACEPTSSAAPTPQIAFPAALARTWLGWLGAAMLLPAAFAMTHPALRAALAGLALVTLAGAFTAGRRPGPGFHAVSAGMAAFLAILAADALLPL